MRTNRMQISAMGIAVLVAASSAHAAVMTESTSAPGSNIIASQMTDLGPGPQDNGRDYTDNSGPPGQTFMVTKNSTLTAVTVLGRGDDGGGVSGFNIQIGSVAANGAITALDTEAVTGTPAVANDYVTITLATPVALSAGTTYDFNIYTANGWFGLAHSSSDVYASGTAFNNDTSTTGGGTNRTFANGFVAPNPGNYDYVFAAQGTVPEPASIGLVGLAAAGLLARRRRV